MKKMSGIFMALAVLVSSFAIVPEAQAVRFFGYTRPYFVYGSWKCNGTTYECVGGSCTYNAPVYIFPEGQVEAWYIINGGETIPQELVGSWLPECGIPEAPANEE